MPIHPVLLSQNPTHHAGDWDIHWGQASCCVMLQPKVSQTHSPDMDIFHSRGQTP